MMRTGRGHPHRLAPPYEQEDLAVSFESETDTDLIRHGPDAEPRSRWTRWAWNALAAAIAALGIALLLMPYDPPSTASSVQAAP